MDAIRIIAQVVIVFHFPFGEIAGEQVFQILAMAIGGTFELGGRMVNPNLHRRWLPVLA